MITLVLNMTTMGFPSGDIWQTIGNIRVKLRREVGMEIKKLISTYHWSHLPLDEITHGEIISE